MAKRDPLKTRNGRTRLKPFTLDQLYQLQETASRKKEKHRIGSRIKVLLSKQ